MNRCQVMRAALAVLLGCAGAAPGRNVPVYREYTVPISFDDDQGDRSMANMGVPDLVALRSIQGVQSRETLMGKETLLELSFGRGPSLFRDTAPMPGKLTPPASGDAGRRRQKGESSQNWLVKSLSLPTLGQTGSNTAVAVMAIDGKESSWGWLVDEVAKSSAGQELSPEDLLTDAKEFNPLLREQAEALEIAGDANALPDSLHPKEEDVPDRHSPGRDDRAGSDLGRPDRPGKARADFAVLNQGSRPTEGAGGMSQTRDIIAGYSENARADFASLRESLIWGAAANSSGENSAQLERMAVKWPSGAGRMSEETGRSGPSALGLAPSAGSGLSWQGGWRTAPAENRALSGMEVPVAVPVAPLATPSRPAVSSGGYKPAWY